MRAHEIINELFTGDTDWHWGPRTQQEWLAGFTVDGIEYTAEFFGEDRVAYNFFVRDNGNMSITGSGNAALVFKNAIAILKDYIDQRNPMQVSMTANRLEPSRIKLYTAMMKRLAPMVPDYAPDAYDEKNFRVFTITKTNPD